MALLDGALVEEPEYERDLLHGCEPDSPVVGVKVLVKRVPEGVSSTGQGDGMHQDGNGSLRHLRVGRVQDVPQDASQQGVLI